MRSEKPIYYVYIYLDPRKPGKWEYKDWMFDFEPFYVGYGKNSRISQHLSPSSLNKKSRKANRIKKIFKVTGNPPYFFKVYSNLSFLEANDIETNIIHHFGRLDLGTGILTNRTNGGSDFPKITRKSKTGVKSKSFNRPNTQSREIVQKAKDGTIVKIWKTVSEASRAMKLKSESSIRMVCKGRGKTAKGYYWEYGKSSYTPPKDKLLKEVFQYHRDGTFIRSFISASFAQDELGLGISAEASIRMCANGKAYTAHGFKWFYQYQGDSIKPFKVRASLPKPVECFDTNLNFVKSYRSIVDAEKDLKIYSIGWSCRLEFGKKTVGGFYWRYSSLK